MRKPLAFASQGLVASETCYSIHKLEFLALKAITEKFRDYLYGAKFEMWTDNNSLTYMGTSTKLDATGHRLVAALAKYEYSIHYHMGRHNMDVDALSLQPHDSTAEVIVSVDGMRSICNHSGMGALSPGSPPNCTTEMLGLLPKSVPQVSVNYMVLNQSPLPRLSAADWQEAQEKDPDVGDVIKDN